MIAEVLLHVCEERWDRNVSRNGKYPRCILADIGAMAVMSRMATSV